MAVTLRGSGQTPVQIVQATFNTVSSTSSTSYVTTGFSVTITPTNSSNRILVSVNSQISNQAGSVTYATIYRGSTNLSPLSNGAMCVSYGANSANVCNAAMQILDAPATTSAVTYTVFFRVSGGAAAAFGDSSSGFSIVAQELAYA